MLVLEDQVTARMVRMALERAGCEVSTATAGPSLVPDLAASLRLREFVSDRNDWRKDRRRRGRKA